MSNVTYSNSWTAWPPVMLADRQAQAQAQAQYQQAQFAQLYQQYQQAVSQQTIRMPEPEPPAPKFDARDDYDDDSFFEPRE